MKTQILFLPVVLITLYSCEDNKNNLKDPNIAELEQELADVMAMIIILEYYGYVKMENIKEGIIPKLTKLKKYSKIKNLNKIIKNL